MSVSEYDLEKYLGIKCKSEYDRMLVRNELKGNTPIGREIMRNLLLAKQVERKLGKNKYK